MSWTSQQARCTPWDLVFAFGALGNTQADVEGSSLEQRWVKCL